MIPLTRKQFIAISVGAILLIILIVVVVIVSGQKTITIEAVQQSQPRKGLVDFGSVAKKFSAEEKETMTQGLVDFIQPSGSKTTLENGAIVAREDSYKKTLFEDKIPVVTILFDVEKLQRTYILRWDGGEEYEFNILSVKCADASEQQEAGWECKDVGP